MKFLLMTIKLKVICIILFISLILVAVYVIGITYQTIDMNSVSQLLGGVSGRSFKSDSLYILNNNKAGQPV